MVQTVVAAQELYLKAALVDREELAALQQSCDLVGCPKNWKSSSGWFTNRLRFPA
jgi:L-rhamnose isomerase/sugar isomerase